MAFDQHKNLAVASVVTPPSPAASGTTLVVGAGQGARFGAVPFNATVWPIDMAPDPTTAEVVRVTARTSDTLTIVRAQEGTTARTILAGDLFAATITALSLTDIESGTNFPLITTPGTVTAGADLSVGSGLIKLPTTDGADTGTLSLTASNAIGLPRGAFIQLAGNEAAGTGGILFAVGNNAAAGIDYYAAASGAPSGRMHHSGGFSWGSTTDPGAGNLSVAGDAIVSGNVRGATVDGADNHTLYLTGAGTPGEHRGGFMALFGNETSQPGLIQFVAGNTPTGAIDFHTGPATKRGTMHPSGGFSWGGTSDQGAGVFFVGPGDYIAGSAFVRIAPGSLHTGVTTTAAATQLAFYNPNGAVGSIQTGGSSTTFATTSDARLKTPLNRHTSVDVLRDTLIHNFTWKADGQPGRGVFAQEAVEVLPAAVSVGGDERDAGGNLTRPWGVDYSKYVPDLITGWQEHDARLAALERMSRHGDLIPIDAERPRVQSLQQIIGESGRQAYRTATKIYATFHRWLFPKDPSWI